MELAGSETVENGNSNPVPPLKKAIILPILGKKKNSLLPQTTTTSSTTTAPTSVPVVSVPVKEKRGFELDTSVDKEPDSDDTSSEKGDKRGPGRPKKSRSSLDESPPELVPQITIPPIKKRLPANSSKDSSPVPANDISFKRVKLSETPDKKRSGSSKDMNPVPTDDTSFERVKLSETVSKRRSGLNKDMNPVPIDNTSLERVSD